LTDRFPPPAPSYRIQGHDLGRKFQCLVCHDGITSFAGGLLGTDELYFPFYDLGLPWSSSSAHHSLSDDDVDDSSSASAQARRNFGPASLADWRKWDPSEHFAQWATPQLVIHSSKDYRLPIAEGLAAFNILRARGVEAKFLTFPVSFLTERKYGNLKANHSFLVLRRMKIIGC
jgi:pimeloyl-ACP methyl ester carboxylesterase